MTIEEINAKDFDISKEQREEINKSLDEYEKQIKLPDFGFGSDCPSYLTMKISDLRKLSPQELSEAGYLLAQYRFYISRCVNRLRVWKRWGEKQLDIATTANFDKIGNTGWNERMLVARNSSEYCHKLNDFLFHVNSRLDRLYDLPSSIKDISDTIVDLKFAAIRAEKGD